MCSRRRCGFCCWIGAFPATDADRGRFWPLGADLSGTRSDPPQPARSHSAYGSIPAAHRPNRPFGSVRSRKAPERAKNAPRPHRWNTATRHSPPRRRAPSNLQLSALICPIVLDHEVFPLSARSALPAFMPQKGPSRNSPLGSNAQDVAIKRHVGRVGASDTLKAN